MMFQAPILFYVPFPLCSSTLGQFNIRTVAIFRLKFRRFLVIFSKITQFSEMLYTSLESPNIQLSETLST